jgi:hypothetical protein
MRKPLETIRQLYGYVCNIYIGNLNDVQRLYNVQYMYTFQSPVATDSNVHA